MNSRDPRQGGLAPWRPADAWRFRWHIGQPAEPRVRQELRAANGHRIPLDRFKRAGHPAGAHSSAILMSRYSHFISTPPWTWKPSGAAPEYFGSVYSTAFLPLIQQVKVSPFAWMR